MKGQYKKKAERNADIETVGVVLDNEGKTVRLFEKKLIPHMWKDVNMLVLSMPRVHPSMQVQVEVLNDMYFPAAKVWEDLND